MPCPEATSRIVAPGKRSRCLSNDSANGVDQGSCWGRGQDGTAAFQCLTTLHRRYSLRARAQDGWQCGSLAESVCDILRRTRNGSPLLKRFHRRGRPKGLSLLFPVLVNELECVELGLQLLNTYIPILNLFLERLHLA